MTHAAPGNIDSNQLVNQAETVRLESTHESTLRRTRVWYQDYLNNNNKSERLGAKGEVA